MTIKTKEYDITESPFSYKVWIYLKHFDRYELSDYSGRFKSIERAEEWYNEHGKWLERKFGRKLVLINNL